MNFIEIASVSAPDIHEPLHLLEEWLREGEPVPEDLVWRLRDSIENERVDVLQARERDRVVGVVLLTYRLNVSLGGFFASIEDLYVVRDARRRGVGRALLEAAGERCAARGVSYVEAQVEGEEAAAFYAAVGYEAQPDVRVLSLSLPVGRKL